MSTHSPSRWGLPSDLHSPSGMAGIFSLPATELFLSVVVQLQAWKAMLELLEKAKVLLQLLLKANSIHYRKYLCLFERKSTLYLYLKT